MGVRSGRPGSRQAAMGGNWMPVVNDMTIKVGGEAGQGVESSGAGFAKALARAGIWIYGLQDYMSRIRGGHNFYQVRVSDEEIWACRDEVHMLLPLTSRAVACCTTRA